MSWFLLVLAGLFEISWAVGLKYTEGFTKLWPTLWTVSSLIISFTLLGLAVRTLSVGTAYGVWVGIGAIGTAILGIVLFAESASLLKFFSLTFIFIGIIGLKIAQS